MINLNKFNYFFILDLANNHQGDLKHSFKIIDSFGKKINSLGINATIKLQFRNLKTYLHPSSISKKNKYINRFKSTELTLGDYRKIVERIKKHNLYTMTTPFDEESFDLIQDLNIDIIKIASVSSSDQTLLNKVKNTNKPVVISVGGQDIEQIDQIVNFFQTYTNNFVIQHCVAIYPTQNKDLELNQISFLKKRFPKVKIGFSTHEDPNNVDAIKIATSKGANFFERHIGIETKNYKLNDYSSNLDQFSNWIKSFKETLEMLGAKKRKPVSYAESSTLNLLSRGVYVKKNIDVNQQISLQNTYFAFPLQKNQISSSQFNENRYIAKKKIYKDKPIFENIIEKKEEFNLNNHILNIMLQFKSMLTESMTPINSDAEIELSHHYGIDRFREFGCLIITCFNYDYAKKLILLLPRQKHPYHFHKKKYETFQILQGDLEAEIDGNPMKLKTGDICTISVGQWHKFQTSNGVIFEEISTKHYNNDSFYKDPKIAKINREIRKTKLTNWRDYFKNNF